MTQASSLGKVTRLAYAIGALPFGMKDAGISFLLLIFYNQVVGLPAAWVGAVLMISLILDGFLDPFIGQVSDTWHSRWGRRHPFLYASAALIAVLYYLLWNPPAGWSHGAMLAYLLCLTVLVRFTISLYEVPSSALLAELTEDYAERSSLSGSRLVFAWIGGVLAVSSAYVVFLRPTPEHPIGQLNPDGYGMLGLAHGLMMMIAMLVSAIGTHGQIPALLQPTRLRPGLLRTLQDMSQIYRNRSLLIVIGTGMLTGLAVGMSNALNIYVSTYLWGFNSGQIATISLSSLVGVLLGFFVGPRLSRRFSKRAIAVVAGVLYVAFHSTAIVLRLLDLFPANGTPALLPTYIALLICAMGNILIVSTMVGSMLADVVEDNEVRTGLRSEGVIFAAQMFTQKCISGLGVFTAGIVLSLVSFPEKATPANVPEPLILKLAVAKIAIHAIVYLAAMALLSRYAITRQRHQDNLTTLKNRRATVD